MGVTYADGNERLPPIAQLEKEAFYRVPFWSSLGLWQGLAKVRLL